MGMGVLGSCHGDMGLCAMAMTAEAGRGLQQAPPTRFGAGCIHSMTTRHKCNAGRRLQPSLLWPQARPFTSASHMAIGASCLCARL